VIDQRSRAEVVAAIEATGVVAVIRLADASMGRDVARALADGGVTALEVTMTVLEPLISSTNWRTPSPRPAS
jgi:2-keto-3-deoxy-6-phosphogluconate aldolase